MWGFQFATLAHQNEVLFKRRVNRGTLSFEISAYKRLTAAKAWEDYLGTRDGSEL